MATMSSRLAKFVKVRNNSPHQSNMQFECDARDCGLSVLMGTMPQVFANSYGRCYVWEVGEGSDKWFLVEACGRCGYANTRDKAFRAACSARVSPEGLAEELGFPLSA